MTETIVTSLMEGELCRAKPQCVVVHEGTRQCGSEQSVLVSVSQGKDLGSKGVKEGPCEAGNESSHTSIV